MSLKALSIASILAGLIAAYVFVVLRGDEPSRKRIPARVPAEVRGSLAVQVVGRGFYWQFRFPGPDGQFDTSDDVTSEKEIHLPLHRKVEFLVGSDDYIYTLSVPALGLKRIAVPEMWHPMRFETTTAGTFDIAADPMCSVRLLHGDDMGRIIVQSNSAFEAWYGGLL